MRNTAKNISRITIVLVNNRVILSEKFNDSSDMYCIPEVQHTTCECPNPSIGYEFHCPVINKLRIGSYLNGQWGRGVRWTSPEKARVLTGKRKEGTAKIHIVHHTLQFSTLEPKNRTHSHENKTFLQALNVAMKVFWSRICLISRNKDRTVPA